jgi:hypothetical protein
MTNERRVDDKLQEQLVIHQLKLVVGHNGSTRGHNMRNMDDISTFMDAKL